MYSVRPKGINIKQNDRDVPDGFLQESINLQWRDGSYRPIPERMPSLIDATREKDQIILHKVSDEDKVNVLMFSDALGFAWHGTIEDGVYVKKETGGIEIDFPSIITGFPTITDFDSLSFTILNGIIYFMSTSQEFYYQVQFDEVKQDYEIKDMYAWKDLIPFYSVSSLHGQVDLDSADFMLMTQCGVILTRFTLVLKTGEEVLHSPIYADYMYALNRSDAAIEKDALLTNIHTQITTELQFPDQAIFDDNVSAINIYASTAFYTTKVVSDMDISGSETPKLDTQTTIDGDNATAEIQRLSEEPFYLVKTINKNSTTQSENNIIFYVGALDLDIEFPKENIPSENVEASKIDVNTIAAGAVMPVDNFTAHKLFGKISSSSGRIIIDNPKTVLSIGHMRSLARENNASKVGFNIDTEDGVRRGIAYLVDKAPLVILNNLLARGLLSYPDSRANLVGGSGTVAGAILLYKTRANKAHNLSCAFNFTAGIDLLFSISPNGTKIDFIADSSVTFFYGTEDEITPANPPIIDPVFYTSENRLQFSEIGEFSVWPVLNSYRVGEGRIAFVGSNSIDPANSDFIAPLLVGTSDGVYTVNFDITGNSLVQSITRAATMPALSSNNIQIDQSLIYVSDKGLIAINNGKIVNLTIDFFPEQSNGLYGNFPPANDVYPNYYFLTNEFFNFSFPQPPAHGTYSNPYLIGDIIEYLREAVFAYDGRRNNLWCCNTSKNFSLLYNLITKQWDISTYKFSDVLDFFSSFSTVNGVMYSRNLVVNSLGDVDILSAEDFTKEVETHLLTRPLKMQTNDEYKKIQRLISRCELYRSTTSGYFTFGLWGKQDMNRNKVNIPLVAYKDSSSNAFPNDVRQDIPVGRQRGKYKTITILQGGKLLPSSSIGGYDIVAIPVENNILR